MLNKSDAVKSVQAEREADKKKATEEQLDEGLEETFLASDPLSVTTPPKPAGSPDTDRGVN